MCIEYFWSPNRLVYCMPRLALNPRLCHGLKIPPFVFRALRHQLSVSCQGTPRYTGRRAVMWRKHCVTLGGGQHRSIHPLRPCHTGRHRQNSMVWNFDRPKTGASCSKLTMCSGKSVLHSASQISPRLFKTKRRPSEALTEYAESSAVAFFKSAFQLSLYDTSINAKRLRRMQPQLSEFAAPLKEPTPPKRVLQLFVSKFPPWKNREISTVLRFLLWCWVGLLLLLLEPGRFQGGPQEMEKCQKTRAPAAGPHQTC